MAEPNPQPVQEESAPQPTQVKGGGVMGPIVAAVIIVAGIAGITKMMVLPVLEKGGGTSLPAEYDAVGQDSSGDNSSPSKGETGTTVRMLIDLGEPILVNIRNNQGGQSKVLSAKVSFMLKTTAIEPDDKETVKTKVTEFKPILVDVARSYLTRIEEDGLEFEDLHKKELKRMLNDKFDIIIGEDKMSDFMNSNPVEQVLLPSFTAQ